MTQATYTVIDRHGQPESGLSLSNAADLIMQHDGNDWEIKPDPKSPGWYVLWVSQASRNSPSGNRPLVPSVIFGMDETEIYLKVIGNAELWDGQTAMTDQAYIAMLAEMAAEEELLDVE